MRISTRARYGVRLMLELGAHYGKGPLFLKEIAQAEEISEKYLSQIIIPLKAAGLVDSQRGARGGYVLGRPPFGITVKEIVEILEGGLNVVDCVGNENACTRISKCVTRDIWTLLSKSIAQTLAQITLETLVKMYRKRVEATIEYTI